MRANQQSETEAGPLKGVLTMWKSPLSKGVLTVWKSPLSKGCSENVEKSAKPTLKRSFNFDKAAEKVQNPAHNKAAEKVWKPALNKKLV